MDRWMKGRIPGYKQTSRDHWHGLEAKVAFAQGCHQVWSQTQERWKNKGTIRAPHTQLHVQCYFDFPKERIADTKLTCTSVGKWRHYLYYLPSYIIFNPEIWLKGIFLKYHQNEFGNCKYEHHISFNIQWRQRDWPPRYCHSKYLMHQKLKVKCMLNIQIYNPQCWQNLYSEVLVEN